MITGNEGVTTVAVKTLKENATEVERNDLHSELQVSEKILYDNDYNDDDDDHVFISLKCNIV